MNKIKNTNRLYLAVVVVFIFGSELLRILSGDMLRIFAINHPEAFNAVGLVFNQIRIVVPVLLYYPITKQKITEVIPFRKIKGSVLGMVFLFYFLIVPPLLFLNVFVQIFSPAVNTDVMYSLMDNSFWLNLIMIAVLPGICEELVFRGALFHGYRQRGIIIAAVLSGFLFGLMHLNFVQFGYAFLMGVICALFIEATGSIFSSMLVHFALNAGSVIQMHILTFLISQASGSAGGIDADGNPFFVLAGIYNSAAMQMGQKWITMIMAFVFLVASLISVPLAVMTYLWIADHSGRGTYIRGLFKRKYKQFPVEIQRNTQQHNDEIQQQKPRLITIPLIIGILVCFGYMFWRIY